MGDEFKHICESCGGHIAYDAQYVGRTVQCPHCGKEITLGGTNPTAQSNASPAGNGRANEARVSSRRIISTRNIIVLAVVILVAAAAGIGLQIASKHGMERQRREAEEIARSRAEADRLKAESERAKAESEMAKLKAEEEEKAKAAAKAAAEAEAAATAEAARIKAAEAERLEGERKARATKNPVVWAMWEEQDHEAIQLVSTRQNDAIIKHKGVSTTVKYEDMPSWLRTSARAKYKEDGEAKGFIRELDGKIYDLRATPGGWVSLPSAEVIQIIEDGYLLIDAHSLYTLYAQKKVFKLKHNGLNRILNKGDRIQLTAMSVGTYTYENKKGEI